jgi:succinate dehydrogenase / fumarate reductase iron-sulfur subunit
MVAAMDRERFGSCTNMGECEAVCPKEVSIAFIARLNRDLVKASFRGRGAAREPAGV